MKIGVYFNRSTFNRIRQGQILNELKYLVQEGIPEGVEFFVFCPVGIEWWNKKINGIGYDIEEESWRPERFSFPNAIYDRATFPEKEKEIGHEVRKKLKQEYNIIFLNNKHFFNKWETHQTLSLSEQIRRYLPDTEIYDQLMLEKFLNRYRTVYIKDSAGRLGHNIFKIRKENTGKYIAINQIRGEIYQSEFELEGLNDRIINGELAGKTIIIQQGIELAKLKDKPFDIRILVQKNGHGNWEVVDKSLRVASDSNSVVTNISAGGEVRSFGEIIPMLFPFIYMLIEQQINIMSISICHCLEERYGRLGELGIDAALDVEGRIWLLEVNGKPAKTCIHNSNNPELIHIAYSNIVKYFKYLNASNAKSSSIEK